MSRPLQALPLYEDGHPWYPYRHDRAGVVLYASYPALPADDGHWEWVRVEAAQRPPLSGPPVELDLLGIAQLIFTAGPDDVIEITADQILYLVHAALIVTRTDPGRLFRLVGRWFWADPKSPDRMGDCLQLALGWTEPDPVADAALAALFQEG